MVAHVAPVVAVVPVVAVAPVVSVDQSKKVGRVGRVDHVALVVQEQPRVLVYYLVALPVAILVYFLTEEPLPVMVLLSAMMPIVAPPLNVRYQSTFAQSRQISAIPLFPTHEKYARSSLASAEWTRTSLHQEKNYQTLQPEQ